MERFSPPIAKPFSSGSPRHERQNMPTAVLAAVNFDKPNQQACLHDRVTLFFLSLISMDHAKLINIINRQSRRKFCLFGSYQQHELSERLNKAHASRRYIQGGCVEHLQFSFDGHPPFCFHELLVYLGASPDGNMADGIYYGPAMVCRWRHL